MAKKKTRKQLRTLANKSHNDRYFNDDYTTLIKEMSRVIDWHEFFPKLEGNLPRHGKQLTRYKKSKLKHEYYKLRELGFNFANPAKDKFIPIRKSKKRNDAIYELNQPDYLKGIFFAEKMNPEDVYFEDGELTLHISDAIGKMKIRRFVNTPLNDNQLEEYLKVMLENIPEGTIGAAFMNGANFFDIHDYYKDDPTWPDWFIDDALTWWNKYSEMAERGEKRIYLDSRGRQQSKGVARHPQQWFFGVMFRQKEKRKLTKRQRIRMK